MMRRLAFIVLTFGLATGGLATAQEVLSPWDNGAPSAGPAPTPPQARGRRVRLRPMENVIPPWALYEVLNPWGPNAGGRAMSAEERALSNAARTHARRLSRCFPQRHSRTRSWIELHPPSAESAVEGDVDGCVRQVMERHRPASPTFVLVMRFDERGLRDVYAMEKDAE